ncbi:leucine-rich_repeat domain-containing protein [Hexamita inflata]|uniref:Leucine-rich repeat domain-containing protein n=1 Tax=Hexamita inflata TaxID=28002 RepID=A0AA86R603_9EUKA|nr:leucine-rich repeat domain-containing protein [Hexamita inflata]
MKEINSVKNGKKQYLSEYDQNMIRKFEDKVLDGVLEIKDNQELTNLDFIQNLSVCKLKLENCQNIQHQIFNDTITELYITKCKFTSLLDIQINNLEVLSLQENRINDIQNVIVKMKCNPKFSKLLELDISEQLNFTQNNQNISKESLNINTEQLKKQNSIINLVKLTLEGNGITDIDELSTFVNLKELNLSQNKNINIGSIKYLTQLTKLSLENCKLVNIQNISFLTNLTDLNLNENQVDITPLSNLSQLNNLHLFGCGLASVQLSPLQNLLQLVYLQLEANEIYDISTLNKLINLKHLELQCNNINDISSIKNLENLTFLDISHCEIKYFSVLRKLINLEELYMCENRYFDISQIQYLVKLRKIDLCLCNIYDISPLRPLINLQYLDISENNIFDISPLAQLKNLTELQLEYNMIANFSQLEHLSIFNTLFIDNQTTPTLQEELVYVKMKGIDECTTFLQNMSQMRKQMRSRVNLTKTRVSLCKENSTIIHLHLFDNITSLFQQLDSIGQYQ